ncbi:hypothetical protein ABTZ03_01350 [Kitasatospora sp. NPDC096077]|uniref:hypothetical protein n=1 Tax=Kitasatospora sp. NPDC096077 TaxID=3155544 RepID=UPI0033286139
MSTVIVSETPEFHVGDQVWVYRDCSYGTVESAVVVAALADRSLRLEFADGHRNHLRHGRVELHPAPGTGVDGALRTSFVRLPGRPTAGIMNRP